MAGHERSSRVRRGFGSSGHANYRPNSEWTLYSAAERLANRQMAQIALLRQSAHHGFPAIPATWRAAHACGARSPPVEAAGKVIYSEILITLWGNEMMSEHVVEAVEERNALRTGLSYS